MPKYSKYRKSRRRRRNRKRKRKRKSGRMNYNIIRNILTADTVYVKLRYHDPAIFTGSTALALTYRGNSAFDPNFSTSTNTQPPGFDQYAVIYSHYEVIGSTFKVQLTNLAPEPVRLMLIPTITDSPPSVIAGYGNPYGKESVLGGVNGNGIRTMSSYMKTKKLYGRTTASVNFAAPVGDNPSKQWYWHLRARALTLNDLDIDGNVSITYFVKFWQRNVVFDS